MTRFKKSLVALGLLFMACGASAQTDFRHISFTEAKAAAQTENKLIFIDFYTSWCGPCKLLAKEVFPTKEAGDYLNSNYVCLKIDAEKEEGPALARQYGVEAYPTLVVAKADGEMIGSFAGYKPTSEFIAAVKMCANPEMTPERVKERYEGGERNTELVIAYSAVIRDESRNYEKGLSRATQVLDDYFLSLPDAQRLDPENMPLLTTYVYTLSNPRARFAVDHRNDVAENLRGQFAEQTENIFRNDAFKYFCSPKMDSEKLAAYDAFKKEAAGLGYSEKFARLFEFADKRNSSDDAGYLAFCDENILSLAADEQTSLVTSLSGIVPTDTPEQKQTLSRFLRKHIGSLNASAVYWTGSLINTLENGH